MNEERLERRAHWAQIAIGLLIAATAWCVKLEFNTSQQAQDFKDYKRDMKATVKELDNATDRIEHDAIENRKDIEWLKRSCGQK